MNDPAAARVEALFDDLVDESLERQREVLHAVRGADAQVADRVAALLDADLREHPILQQDAGTLASGLLAEAVAARPARIGRYIIQSVVGEGGMGTVYLARREDLGDCVALKLLRDPWSSPARRRRFASEQRLLAALNHRSIARLYDAGVAGETPWFAMEYVEGDTIAVHAAQRQLNLRQRLACFRTVCEAVSYAHRNLIVHLDLKPSNVLVTADGEVKLVDFGIARHLAADGAADRTTTQHRWLSLNYAAPEQIRGEPVNVQADVYSLGVILYELITGRRPHERADLGITELVRHLEDEPCRASAAARVNADGGVRASTAQWRDLDVLCSTALHRDKAIRYRTVDALIADLDRFLDDEPLAAQTVSARAYRLRKFVTRHRRALAASTLAALTLAGLVTLFNLRLIEARNRAVSSELRMQRVHSLMLNLFDGDDQAAGPAEGLRVVSLLERGVKEAEALAREPELQAELRHTLGGLYLKLGRPDLADPLIASAWTARQSLFGAEHDLAMQSQRLVAELRVEQSRIDEAEQLARQALTIASRRAPAENREVAASQAVLGKVLAINGSYAEAIAVLDRAVATLAQAPPSKELSEALGDLANAHYHAGHIDEARAVNEHALAFEQSLFGDRHPNLAVTLFNLGNIRLDFGDYAEGERLFRRALDINQAWYGAMHPKSASNRLMLGRAVAYLGRLDEAGELYAAALEAFRAAYGDDHIRTASVLSLMGDLARDRGRFTDAERLFERAAGVFAKLTGERHEFYLHQLSNLGSVYVRQQRYDAAERVLRTALSQLGKQLPEHRYTALAHLRLATALAGRGDHREAETHAREGYRIVRALPGSPTAELQQAERVVADVSARVDSR